MTRLTRRGAVAATIVGVGGLYGVYLVLNMLLGTMGVDGG